MQRTPHPPVGQQQRFVSRNLNEIPQKHELVGNGRYIQVRSKTKHSQERQRAAQQTHRYEVTKTLHARV